MTTQKTDPGNYFEDFTVGQELVHTSPRTVTEGDAALYTALYGPRFAPTSGATTAEALRRHARSTAACSAGAPAGL